MNLISMLVEFGINNSEKYSNKALNNSSKKNHEGTPISKKSSNSLKRTNSMISRRMSMASRFYNMPSMDSFKIKDLSVKEKCFDYFSDIRLNNYKMYEYKPARLHVSYKVNR